MDVEAQNEVEDEFLRVWSPELYVGCVEDSPSWTRQWVASVISSIILALGTVFPVPVPAPS